MNFGVTGKLANDEDRKTSVDVRERARKNVDVVLKSILAHYGTVEKVKTSEVKIRFGHVTHMNEDQAKKMVDYGISGDFNLSSNLRTGVFGVLEKPRDADDAKNTGGRWNDILKHMDSIIKWEHGLTHMIKADGLYVLGTDGQGVEATDLESEYKGYIAIYNKINKTKDTEAYDKLEGNIERVLSSYKDVERRDVKIGPTAEDANLYDLAKKLIG